MGCFLSNQVNTSYLSEHQILGLSPKVRQTIANGIITQLKTDPLTFPAGLSQGLFIGALDTSNINDSEYPENWKSTINNLKKTIKTLFINSLISIKSISNINKLNNIENAGKPLLNNTYIMIISNECKLFNISNKEYNNISEKILSILSLYFTRGDFGKFKHNEKIYIKYLLSWNLTNVQLTNDGNNIGYNRFLKLKNMSDLNMTSIEEPLINYYNINFIKKYNNIAGNNDTDVKIDDYGYLDETEFEIEIAKNIEKYNNKIINIYNNIEKKKYYFNDFENITQANFYETFRQWCNAKPYKSNYYYFDRRYTRTNTKRGTSNNIDYDYKQSNNENDYLKKTPTNYSTSEMADTGIMVKHMDRDNVTIDHINEAKEIFKSYGLNGDNLKYLFEEIDKKILFDDIQCEFFFQIAKKINDEFHQTMQLIYNEIRSQYIKDNIFYKNSKLLNDNDLCYKKGNVKSVSKAFNVTFKNYIDVENMDSSSNLSRTNSQQKIYFNKDYEPKCARIFDWVRCSMVCLDGKELILLFNKLIELYKGKIINIENKFDKNYSPMYNYRDIVINFAFESKKDTKYTMICEIKLILLKYIKQKKIMNIFENILIADDSLDVSIKFSNILNMDKSQTKKWFVE